jgi:hypothetical protein
MAKQLALRMPLLGLLTLIAALSAVTAKAERFVNSYVSFDLPPNWSCNLDGTEWLCISKFAKNGKEAIIVLTAKEAGPNDSLLQYEKQLRTPRTIVDSKGKSVSSRVLTVKSRSIGGHTWVDGLQERSEIESYFTRYLATTKDRLAILVTFSAHKTHYTKYSSDFLKAVESLKVVAAPGLAKGSAAAPVYGQQEIIGRNTAPIITGGQALPAPPPPGASSDRQTKVIALVLLLAAVGLIIWRRLR